MNTPKKTSAQTAKNAQKTAQAVAIKKLPAYNHLKLEKQWRAFWQEQKTYQTLSADKAIKKGMKPYYTLDMFPYPSGAGLHVGHPRGYISSDVLARMKRMQGFNVLHPMGFDSFGLPTEQYAIATGKNPVALTDVLIKRYKEQLASIGFSFDWDRQVSTHDPEYYHWTQWIFLKLYNAWYNPKKNKAEPIETLIAQFATKKDWQTLSEQEQQARLMQYRLAYEGIAEINWCAELGTVLANDEIYEKEGKMFSERGDFPVERKPMRQWFMRITAFADRLIDDLEGLDWPTSIKDIQKNWIGKSQGSDITFALHGVQEITSISVFTTRADTLHGVTYVVLAPEHPLVANLLPLLENTARVEQYLASIKQLTDQDRTDTKREKTGICLKGITATNPINGQKVPVWIADYVLAGYGTGAVMAVPAHDERDFAFAKKYNLPITSVIEGFDGTSAYTAYGTLINSGAHNGLTSVEAKKVITKAVKGILTTKYKIRDAIFARQRYWGEPIPLIHTKNDTHGQHATSAKGATNAQGTTGVQSTTTIACVSEKKLPLVLPKVSSYKPTGTGESPLASVKAWVSAGYETNTMPGWAGSSWYFLRYMDPQNKKAFADKKELSYWKQVDMYVGGQEHATGHLLYARFWHKALYDLGFVDTKEPFKALRNQGMILAEDGRKMSKRWGNVINPDDVVKIYGADTLRVYELFMGPFEASLPWSTESIIGARRFIERVWRLSEKVVTSGTTSIEAKTVLHKTIKKVTEDITSFSFNTAVSAMMICLNALEKESAIAREDYLLFVQLLAPFAPHMTEAVWQAFAQKGSIHQSVWPVPNKKLLIETQVTVMIQVNGKVRDQMTIAANATHSLYETTALSSVKVQTFLAGAQVKRVIVVPGRIVNIVV